MNNLQRKINFLSKPIFSVIIPCYNVEKYLVDCLDSVCSQSLQNIQIICVDDGSADGTGKILQKRAKKDRRIEIYTQPNLGVSAARNTGLKHAKGRFVYFLDADDMVDGQRVLEKCKEEMGSEIDVLCGAARTIYDSPDLEKKFPDYAERYRINTVYEGALSGSDAIISLRKNKEWNVTVALKTFRRSFLEKNKISFLEGIIHEDALFTFEVLFLAKKVRIVNYPLYIRRIRDNSIMTKAVTHENTIGYLSVLMEELSFIERNRHIRAVDERVCASVPVARQLAVQSYLQLGTQEREKLLKSLNAEQRLYFRLFVKNEAELNEQLQAIREKASYES